MPLLDELVTAAADRAPDAVAVVDGDRRLTYRELDVASAAVAAGLRARGVSRGDRVAVVMRRRAELLAVILGVLRAGAAFVPSDVRTPGHRLVLMAEDASARVVVTEPDLAERFADSEVRSRITFSDDLIDPPRDAAVEPLAAERSGADLAYVLYTSGSTGRPKGVAISHEAITGYLTWAVDEYGMEAGTGAPLFTSVGFDLTLTSLFGPLLAGRTVTVVPESDELLLLADLLGKRPDFSFIKLTPQHLDLLTELLCEGVREATRCVVVGGDALWNSSVRDWLAKVPDSVVVNEYGPTETVVGCVMHRVPNDATLSADGPVPIGGPVPGALLYVLDPALRPVPVGEVGELYVGGSCAGGRYLGRPALTAERFLPDPIGPAGGVMYRTGDRVRCDPDGRLEYVGRADRQVKVRGHRVEPAEVQAVLRTHPGVTDAVVLGRPGSDGVQLMAAVVGDADPSDVRHWLGGRLPEWMVPRQVAKLDVIPLTVNGKVDQEAVLAAMPTGPAPSPAAGPPLPRQASTTEAILTDLMAGVLRRDRVGPDDNFFAFGGDSMRGIQLVARARKAGLRIKVRDIFTHPTAAGLAAVAAPADAAQGEGTRSGPVPLTAIQRWFFELDLAEPAHWNQAVMLDLPSNTDVPALRQAVAHVTADHDALRMRYDRTRDGWVQRLTDGPARVAFDVVDCVGEAAVDREMTFARAAAAAHAGLNLQDGPLLRVVLGRGAADGGDRLLLLAHHLVVDTVSWQILVDDLAETYGHLHEGSSTVRLPQVGRWADWASACAARANQPDVTGWVSRWYAGLPSEVPALPRDDPAAVNDLGGRTEMRVILSPERLQPVVDLLAGQDLRPQDVLLGAFVAAVCEVLACPPPVVDVEGHGREDVVSGVDPIRTVGWFTALHPVFLGTDRDPAALVNAARRTTREAPLSGLGYGLARYLARVPALAGGRHPELLFNYLGRSEVVVSPELGWRLADASSGPPTGSTGIRPYLLEYHPLIISGALRSSVYYHPSCHGRSTVESIVTRIHDLLADPAWLAAAPALQYADAGLDADDLQRVLARYAGPSA